MGAHQVEITSSILRHRGLVGVALHFWAQSSIMLFLWAACKNKAFLAGLRMLWVTTPTPIPGLTPMPRGIGLVRRVHPVGLSHRLVGDDETQVHDHALHLSTTTMDNGEPDRHDGL